MKCHHSALFADRSARFFVGALLVAFAISEAARAGVPRLEGAIAADLTAGGRDAIVFRLPDGAGAGIFLPKAGGGFSLELLPALGPDVGALTLGDANQDGLADLLVTREDGTLFLWKGIGGGDFTWDLIGAMPAANDMHAAHHPASAGPPALTGAERDRIVESLSHDSIRTDPIVTELGPAAALLATDDVRSAASADLDRDGSSEIALVTSDGRLRIAAAGRADRSVDVPLPARFAPRLIASGRFGPGEKRSFAVVGEGPRPRLVIVSSSSTDAPSEATLDLAVREAAAPEAVFNVNVGQGGFVFSPSSVTIQVNDTVHWVWMAGGHNVVSGTSCMANNQFCSPSNTNCATTPTSGIGAVYDRIFPAAGTFPYFCIPHCVFGMTGAVIVQAAALPGAVPDRLPVPLQVNAGAGGSLILTWGASCSPGATAYGIYEGTIPIAGVYDHKSTACPAGTATTATITPTAGDHYYLVVPRTAAAEGSYGKDSANQEIPQGAPVCLATQNLTACL
jgi:plastocyanin